MPSIRPIRDLKDTSKISDVKTLAGALGSYIWVKMPSCLRALNMQVDMKSELINKLYASRQPWMLDCFPKED